MKTFRAPTTKAVGSIKVKKFHVSAPTTKAVGSIKVKKFHVSAPTTKAVGSDYIIKLEPTALVVGLQKVKAALG